MSQMTATARPLRVPRRVPTPTPLRSIPASIGRTGNGVFAALCIVLLVGGLIALLLLNTALAQGSLVLGDLQRESGRLADTSSSLQEQVDRASSAGALARSASELGMVRMNTRGYIDLSAGTVTGDPEPATDQNAFPIVTSPTPPAAAEKVGRVLDAGTRAAAAASSSAATPTTPGAAGAGAAGSTLDPTAATGQPAAQATQGAPTTTR